MVTKKIRVAAWVMLIAQAGIIFSGGIVRLTGSGLGCTDWPKCTPDSLVTTPEMGIHGLIEFGNRTLAVVLAMIGVVIFLMLWKSRKQRPDLFWLNLGLLAIVPVQAIVGGITVWTKLNPWVVAGHFVPSAIAVGVAAYFVRRTYDTGIRTGEKAPSPLPALGWTILVLTAIVVFFGVLTTGAGPHSGSTMSTRNGLDNIWITRAHAFPVWLMVIATIVALSIAIKRHSVMVKPLVVLLIVELAQGLIGYVQYFTGVPIVLVAFHMIGLSATIAASVAVLDSAYSRSTHANTDRAQPVVH
ncbi:MAG: COX15/CtaA family protein [Brevibacterium aurantiacum]|uniref:Cytochrome c oxidase assembly protein subunit 15 n=1 Tax=Brevibacterium aurantiacum TaxID=273384 RepID=A0A1D7W483_BREAU|nr:MULTISPECIES: COX15/CtaA family protein [Brevibacterium]MDN5550290.1 COX15/CtaA family protein [Brevibacterium sp.]AOP53849.1 Cytochrome oxidase assembly protein [Brevibacterium aurantiacum]AZL05960.1 heme A synthase [Brevibacterium aurantiacum]AZL09522.1 heme A synthase [Brevibacterium aurantiacum]AZL13157.1 heme A synthase [Brevibacterium aurantiacum]